MFPFIIDLFSAGHSTPTKPPAVLHSFLCTNLCFMHKLMNLSILNATLICIVNIT